MSVGNVSTSWRQGFFRPAAALASIWTYGEGKVSHAEHVPVSEEGPGSDFSEDSDSLDPQASAELLFSAQESIIDHDYADAVKKLEKSARYGNSAACAYLANVLTHGLACGDEDHEEERVDINPEAAARWALRGLEVELAKVAEGSTSEAAFSSDIRSPDDMSTPAATPSEAGPFDFQAAADCASTLTLLFRTRKVRVKDEIAPSEKGKDVGLVELAGRIGTLMLDHEALRSSGSGAYSQEKQRKIIKVNVLYLLALFDAERGREKEAESEWRKVAVIGEQGPIGDNSADELVGNARRRIILLQNRRRESENHSPTLSTLERKRPSFERRSSAPHRRAPSATRKATFELGSDEVSSPTADEKDAMSFLAPPSPRSARSMRRSKGAPKSPDTVRQPPLPGLLSFRTLSCIFQAHQPNPAPASVAVESGSAILPPQEKMRSRTSVVSMVHEGLPKSRSMLFPTLRRDMSAASLPDLGNASDPHLNASTTGSTRFMNVRRWFEQSFGEESSTGDAADALRDALRRHDALVLAVESELTDVEEEAGDGPRPADREVNKHGGPAVRKPTAQRLRIKGLDPALAKLEDASRVNVLSVCAVCDAKGVNFPRCPKCGQTYCSRACRLGGGGDGERHICPDSPPSTVTATPVPEAAR